MKEVPIEFLHQVESDIQRINAICSGQPSEMELIDLHREIDGRYQSCIINWGQSMWNYSDKFGFTYTYLGIDAAIDNLKSMKAKLSTYKYLVNAIPNKMPAMATVNVNIQNDIELNVSIQNARSQIEDMTSLTVPQSKEILERLDLIESIMKSTDNKKTKWEKIGPIIKWLADKSVDIAIALLPLICKSFGLS